MNRAMFSGVAGLKTHQTKMDVIGNNIANVNTYGYKSQRAVFSDIYYQTLSAASAGTANRGGTNPSTVGYGSSLAVVQSIMNQSSMQNTGRGLDVAITGEGFLQVMDGSGNIFYTKAGILDYDSNGYLVDMNGNFVLGAGSSDGTPDSQKIKLDNVGSVDAKQPSVEQTINGIKYTITASNANKNGNVNLTIGASETLPAGQKAMATISANGAITVQLNAFEKFTSMTDLNTAINQAIREANGGKDTAAGTFTITSDKNVFGKDAIEGGWTGTAESSEATWTAPTGTLGKHLALDGTWPNAPSGNLSFTYKENKTVELEITDPDGVKKTYTGTYTAGATALELASGSDKIKLKVTDPATFGASFPITGGADIIEPGGSYKAPKPFLGGAEINHVSKDFSLAGPMTFTNCTVGADGSLTNVDLKVGGETLTGTLNGDIMTFTASAPNTGTITMKIPNADTLKKNLGLANSATPNDVKAALDISAGSHKYVAVKAAAAENTPLTGAEIAGDNFGVNPGTIDGITKGLFNGMMTIMKTSTDFTGTGKVELEAKYNATTNPDNPQWDITMTIGGVAYEGSVDKDTAAASIILKSTDGGYVQVSNPKFDSLTDYYKDQNKLPGQDQGPEPIDGKTLNGIAGEDAPNVIATPATPSKDLGFGSKGFTLTGGTEGGAITLDQLSNISIGADGTVTVSHAEKGTVVAGKISLASFANPSGLKPEGTNYFSSSANSGEPRLCDPGSDGTGSLKSSSLEMSNVDLSGEFADMITTQRGFQANSRIITVSDTMLEELINLKR